MAKPADEPKPVRLSVRVYRWLIAAYPASFRAAYGAPMEQVFRDSCRRASKEGRLAALWMRTAMDWVLSVIEEYARGGVHMSRDAFAKLSGWALIVGPVLFMIAWIAANRPEYSQYNFASLPIDRVANQVGMPLAVVGQVLISLGVVGILLRYAWKAGASTFWLGLAVLCGAVLVVGAVWMNIDTEGNGWLVFMSGLFGQFIAMALFGVANLRRRLLPRWNGLPLLAGIWLPGFILVTGLVPSVPDGVLFYGLWTFSTVMFMGLGYLLQSNGARAANA